MNLKWLKEGRHPLWLFAALLVLVAVMALTGGRGKDTASQEEKRMAEVLSAMAGAGKVEVALFYDKAQADAFGGPGAQKPTGAVVVAQGAGDMGVRLSLIRAVKTLTNLPETAVDVFVMEDGR